MIKYLGRYWNDTELEIYEIEGRKICLGDEWNGEIYSGAFEVADNLIDIIQDNIQIKPIYAVDSTVVDFKIL